MWIAEETIQKEMLPLLAADLQFRWREAAPCQQISFARIMTQIPSSEFVIFPKG